MRFFFDVIRGADEARNGANGATDINERIANAVVEIGFEMFGVGTGEEVVSVYVDEAVGAGWAFGGGGE